MNLDRASRQRLLGTVIATERPAAALARQVKRQRAREIDRQDRRRQRVLRQIREIRRRSALVRIAALSDIQRLAVRRQRHAIGGVVLLRTRQAPDDVGLRPAGAAANQLRHDPRIRVEVQIRAAFARADPRIARSHVKHRRRRGPGDQQTRHQAARSAIAPTLIIVIRDRRDLRDRLRGNDRIGVRTATRHRVDVDEPVLLRHIQAPVRPELQRRRTHRRLTPQQALVKRDGREGRSGGDQAHNDPEGAGEPAPGEDPARRRADTEPIPPRFELPCHPLEHSCHPDLDVALRVLSNSVCTPKERYIRFCPKNGRSYGRRPKRRSGRRPQATTASQNCRVGVR